MIGSGTAGRAAGSWPHAAPTGTWAPASAAACLVLPGGERHLLGHETRIGRQAGNDLILAHRWVSRSHAIIRWSGSDFILVDVGSTHGTVVNGRALRSPHRLVDGDRIWLGTFEVHYSSPWQGIAMDQSWCSSGPAGAGG
jgi:hypothetical protein